MTYTPKTKYLCIPYYQEYTNLVLCEKCQGTYGIKI